MADRVAVELASSLTWLVYEKRLGKDLQAKALKTLEAMTKRLDDDAAASPAVHDVFHVHA